MTGSKKGILFVDTSPYCGDAQKSLVSLIDNLDASRFQAFVLCSDYSDSGLKSQLEGKKNILCHDIKLKAWRTDSDNYLGIIIDLFQFNKVISQITNEYDISIVFANTYYAGFLCTFSLPRKLPFLFNLTEKKCRKSAMFQIVKRSTKTLAVSENLRNYWNKALNFKLAEKLETLNPGFDFEKTKALEEKFRFNETYNWSQDAHIVIMFADMLSYNRHELMLKALAIAHEKDSSVFGLFIGKAFDQESYDYLDHLEETAKEMNMLGSVAFMEHVNSFEYAIIDASEVVVSLAEEDPFPVGLIKALACGVPIIKVDNESDTDVFKNCNAVHAVSDDPKDIADGIIHCISILGKRKDIKAAAISFSKQFEYEQYSNKLHELIDQI